MGRFLLIGAIVGGVILFAWGAISHAGIPWWEGVLHEFENSDAVVNEIQEHVPANGMYFAPQGVFAAVRIRPDYVEGKGPAMGGMLARQLITEFVTAFLLALLLLQTRIRTPAGAAGLFLLAGLAAATGLSIPRWNWYGFSTGFIGLEILDLLIAWGILGLVLGALRRKMAPAAA